MQREWNKEFPDNNKRRGEGKLPSMICPDCFKIKNEFLLSGKCMECYLKTKDGEYLLDKIASRLVLEYEKKKRK